MTRQSGVRIGAALAGALLTCGLQVPGAWAQATVKLRGFDVDHLAPYRDEPGVYLLAKNEEAHVYRVDRAFYDSLPKSVRRYLTLPDHIYLPGLTFDTFHEEPVIPPHLADWSPTGRALYLVHYLDRRWDMGLAVGSKHYSRYELLWTAEEDRSHLDSLVWSPALHEALDYGDLPPPLIQFAGPYHPFYKVPPELRSLAAAETAEVVVEIFRNPELATTEVMVKERCQEAPTITAERDRKRYRCTLTGADIVDVAWARDVVSVLPGSNRFYGEEPAPATYLIEVPSGTFDPGSPELALQYDDGERHYFRLTEATLNALSPRRRQEVVTWHSDRIGNPRTSYITFNTQHDQIPAALEAPEYGDRHRLNLIQFLPGADWQPRIAEVDADPVNWHRSPSVE